MISPGAEIGRQAWLRAMCSLGRAGSIPALGTKITKVEFFLRIRPFLFLCCMELTVQFPDPLQADDEGLIAVGGELSPEYLISAYAQGVFPWFSEEHPIMWWSPNPRLVLIPKDFKLRKSLKQVINSNKYHVKIDTNFKDVIENCAQIPRPEQDGTWITDDMKKAYVEMHELGFAHSFEIYNQPGQLVGGLYGISLGKAFFGESMFFKERDASKVALFNLVEFCKQNSFHFIDAQQSTSHMISLGAKEITRKDFLDDLNKSLQFPTMKGAWKLKT